MTHEWLAITAPNGDQGYQCQRCRLTAIHLPVPKSLQDCPFRPLTYTPPAAARAARAGGRARP